MTLRLYENTHSHLTSGISRLTEARLLQPSSLTVWKLLGDACALVGLLPPSPAFKTLRVPAKLVRVDTSKDTCKVKKYWNFFS